MGNTLERKNKQIRHEYYDDVTMGGIASPITSLAIVYSTVYSGADQRKHQSSASLAFVRGIHRWPVNSPHKWPVTRKIIPFDDAIMKANYFGTGEVGGLGGAFIGWVVGLFLTGCDRCPYFETNPAYLINDVVSLMLNSVIRIKVESRCNQNTEAIGTRR